MAVIHTAYATIKMPGPKGVITLKSDQRDAVACENAALTHARKFSNKEAQDLAAKMARIQQGNTPSRIATPGSAGGGTPRPITLKKGITMTSPSNQPAANQLVAEDKKGATDKEVAVDPNNTDKKLHISTELDAKYELVLITFLRENLDVFAWQISDMPGIPREVIEHKLGIDPAFKPIK
jgi:hypothetical protein